MEPRERRSLIAVRRVARLALILLALLLCRAGASAAEQPARQHPYLYFTAQELPALKARLQQEPFATRWQRLLQHADALLGEEAAQRIYI